MAETVRCPNCGRQVDSAATNCPYCDLKLSGADETPISPRRTSVPVESANERLVAQRSADRTYVTQAPELVQERARGTHDVGIVTQCRVIHERRGCNPVRGMIGTLLVVMLFVTVTQNAGRIVGALLPWMLLAGGLYLLASWIGVAGCLGRTIFGVGGLFLGGSLARSREGMPALVFRVTAPGVHTGAYRDVHLPGPQDGIESGDTVRITGLPINGRYEAFIVVNESANRTLYRQGLFGLVFNIIVIVLMLLWLLAATGGRMPTGG